MDNNAEECCVGLRKFIVAPTLQPLKHKNRLPAGGSHGSCSSFRVREIPQEAQQVVRRHIEVFAERPDILHAGLIRVPLDIGYLSLGHVDSLDKLRLVQLTLFTEKSDLLAKSKFHIYHRR